jgi:hypothetical protein
MFDIIITFLLLWAVALVLASLFYAFLLVLDYLWPEVFASGQRSGATKMTDKEWENRKQSSSQRSNTQ